MNYEKTVKGFLSDYKLERLCIKQKGIWKNNQKEYSHILPEKLMKLNIIETYRKEFWNYSSKNTIKLHKDFHHLNSSQALCFNLFYPFIEENKLDILLNEMKLKLSGKYNCFFEMILDKQEKTNFDFLITVGKAIKICFECKYTERKFDTTKDDKKHIERYNEMYKSRIEGKIKSQYSSGSNFYNNYQIIRNLSYLTDNTYVVFIYPNRNDNLNNVKKLIFTQIVAKKYKNNVRIIYLENLIEDLLKELKQREPKLYTHFVLFKEKYIVE